MPGAAPSGSARRRPVGCAPCRRRAGWCARPRAVWPPGHRGAGGRTAPGARGRDERRVDRERVGRPLARHPDAHGEQPLALARQGLAHRTVGDDAAVAGEHDEPVDEVDPRAEHVLDDDERRRGGAGGRFPRCRPLRTGHLATLVEPARSSAATASRTSCAEPGSSIAVGSSRRTTDGSSARVPASASRWVCPPGQRRRRGVERQVAESHGGEGRRDDRGHGRRAASPRSPGRTRRPGRPRRRPPRARLLQHEPDRARAVPGATPSTRTAPSSSPRRPSRAARRAPGAGWTCPSPTARRAAPAPRVAGSG